MTSPRLIRRMLALSALVVALTAMSGAPPASAATPPSPWWHLMSGVRPSVLEPGVSADEVQRLTVAATGGNFLLENPAAFSFGASSRVFAWNAPAATVQAGLAEIYPGNTVVVTGGPVGEELHPYEITFPKQFVQHVLFANGEYPELFFEKEALKGTISVERVTEGRSDGKLVLLASDVGDAPVNGETTTVSIKDKLPPGVTAQSIEGLAGVGKDSQVGAVNCDLASLTCSFNGVLPPFDAIEVIVGVNVTSAAAGASVDSSISGGGAPDASLAHALKVGSSPGPFGVEDYGLFLEESGGGEDTQAGSHPFQATFALELNQKLATSIGQPDEGLLPQPVSLTKDLSIKLPPGLIGNPTVFPRCTSSQLSTEGSTCPQNTAVGVSVAAFISPHGPLPYEKAAVPLFNMVPNVGEPARFGFRIAGATVFIDTSVRTGGDYGVTTTVSNITQQVAFLASQVTVWGVPGEAVHDISRGVGCIQLSKNEGFSQGVTCVPSNEPHPAPLLSLPTSCTGPLQSSIVADSWNAPQELLTLQGDAMPAMDGCDRLPFTPSITVTPDGQAGSTPTGLTVDAHVPQDLTLNPTGLAESDVKDTTVALPVGVVLNPAAGDGLQACSESQIGFTGENHETETLTFTGEKPSCPDASKVGEVEITTPLLPKDEPLKGSAYVAAQGANPFGSLIALYVVAEDPVSGVLVKLAFDVTPDPVTGQLVTTVKNTPQLPFEDFKLHFFGGDRGPLATPSLCGAYGATASIAPWSQGEVANVSSPSFEVLTGPNGSACHNPLLFAPLLTAGMTNIQAGAFSPLTTTMTREDGQQNLAAVQLHMPPGLSGLLSSVKLCGEEQANQGTCGPESLIGETTVSVGLGGDPFSVKGGKVYITGPYKGAPFGLSIVNPAKAGPYDLGQGACDCVLVRAKIEVDPTTAALTVTTDNSGPYKIPTVLQGIPLQIKHVNVIINRPGFTFNPTNCNPMAVTGTITSTEGATSNLSVPFQVTNCATLKFTPKFAVSTSGKTSKAKGASLTAKLSEPAGAQGTQANIARVKVALPIQLPSQLKTLQKACLAKVFEANPANCPPESAVGHAKVITPLLPVPLIGPAYFVSHGGEAFPSLTMVLQGYGVTVELVGTTLIKKGITSTTFKTVPDVPFNSFELTLPQGKYAALAANLPAKANSSFCGQSLKMPTEFIGQNGAAIHQTTPISVTGCAKAKTRAQKLKAALKACNKKAKAKRASCVKQANKKYGPIKKKKK